MSLARTVQETLSPGREALQVGPLRIAGVVVTADACGGDWWFRAPLDEQRVAIGIGDVTGHGLSTALVATSATSGFASAMTMREPDQLNSQVLISALNITLAHLGRGEYQMSSALAVIDTQTGFIDYAAGGHPAACVYNRVSGQFASLPARGPLLGASVASQYTSRQAQLRPGDIVVWYSDGLTEARDSGGKLYGTQRLSATVQANCPTVRRRPARRHPRGRARLQRRSAPARRHHRRRRRVQPCLLALEPHETPHSNRPIAPPRRGARSRPRARWPGGPGPVPAAAAHRVPAAGAGGRRRPGLRQRRRHLGQQEGGRGEVPQGAPALSSRRSPRIPRTSAAAAGPGHRGQHAAGPRPRRWRSCSRC